MNVSHITYETNSLFSSLVGPIRIRRLQSLALLLVPLRANVIVGVIRYDHVGRPSWYDFSVSMGSSPDMGWVLPQPTVYRRQSLLADHLRFASGCVPVA